MASRTGIIVDVKKLQEFVNNEYDALASIGVNFENEYDDFPENLANLADKHSFGKLQKSSLFKEYEKIYG